MTTRMHHSWSCSTPRQCSQIERSNLFNDEEWEYLYQKAEKLFRSNQTSLKTSIRHDLIYHMLLDAYKATGRVFESMPLACVRNGTTRSRVEWTTPATILGDLSRDECRKGLFDLRVKTQCIKLQVDATTEQVASVMVKDLTTGKIYTIKANKYVVCAGSTSTPGILFNSGLVEKLPAIVSARVAIRRLM